MPRPKKAGSVSGSKSSAKKRPGFPPTPSRKIAATGSTAHDSLLRSFPPQAHDRSPAVAIYVADGVGPEFVTVYVANEGTSEYQYGSFLFQLGKLLMMPSEPPWVSLYFRAPEMFWRRRAHRILSHEHDANEIARIVADAIHTALGIGAKPTKEVARHRAGAKRSGAKPGASRATPKSISKKK